MESTRPPFEIAMCCLKAGHHERFDDDASKFVPPITFAANEIDMLLGVLADAMDQQD